MTNTLEDYAKASTTCNVGEKVHTLPTTYDEKDDMASLQAKLQRRKKPIYVGLVFLAVVIVGVCVSVSSSSSSTANTESAQTDTLVSPSEDTTQISLLDSSAGVVQAAMDSNAGVVQAAMDSISDSNSAEWDSYSHSEDSVAAGPNSSSSAMNASLSVTSTLDPSQNSLGQILAYSLVGFDWTDASKWEYASGATVSSSVVTKSGIILTRENSAEPIRTIEAWSGEKVVYIEWERTSTSDTNIWMLNTKLQSQFSKGNGWPYWGELDLFEMFVQDAVDIPTHDYRGFGGFSDVSSYGQVTMHMGPATENGSPCFCPASPSQSSWYDNTQPMTSGCTAQFSNDASNSIAAVWGSDSTGQYIQLIQKPTLVMGDKLNGADTYDVSIGSGGVTSKIYNNAELFWGVDAKDSCAQTGGHDARSGFPFFESFRLLLEEQKKDDSSASFTVKNIQIFTKNNPGL